MSETDRIKRLKSECLKLFQFRSDHNRYKKEADKITKRVVNLRLNHMIDPTHLKFSLLIRIGNKLSSLNREQFDKLIEDFFQVKKTDYYFQISELEKFPDNYQLGHGVLLTFDSLPQPVKAFAEKLSEGKIITVEPERERMLEEIFKKILVPSDPRVGHWLKISTHSISEVIRSHNASEFAEESLDILRIATPTSRVHLPQWAIGMNKGESKAFPKVTASFSRLPYAPRKDKLITRLNDVCVKPSSDLEERIKDALHFFRIGDNHSPNHQRLFYYVAAIEHLIISGITELTHKFRERGAILLADKVNRRLDRSDRLKELYEARSKIAHGEKSEYDFFLTVDARSYARNCILKILYLIDTCGLKRVSPKDKKKKTGNTLEEYLDNIIYSG